MAAPGFRTARARRLTILCGAGGLCVLALAGYAFRQPLLVRWHLWRLAAEPTRLETYLDCPADSLEDAALRQYVRTPAGLEAFLGSLGDHLASIEQLAGFIKDRPPVPSWWPRLQVLLVELSADGRRLRYDLLHGEGDHTIGDRRLESAPWARGCLRVLGHLIGEEAAPERYRPLVFRVERSEDAVQRFASVHEDKRPEPRPGEAVLVVLGMPHVTLGIIGTTDLRGGVRIDRVQPRSPAERAGLVAGERILEAGAEPVGDVWDLKERLRQRYPAGELHLLLERDGQRRTVAVQLDGIQDSLPPSAPSR